MQYSVTFLDYVQTLWCQLQMLSQCLRLCLRGSGSLVQGWPGAGGGALCKRIGVPWCPRGGAGESSDLQKCSVALFFVGKDA